MNFSDSLAKAPATAKDACAPISSSEPFRTPPEDDLRPRFFLGFAFAPVTANTVASAGPAFAPAGVVVVVDFVLEAMIAPSGAWLLSVWCLDDELQARTQQPFSCVFFRFCLVRRRCDGNSTGPRRRRVLVITSPQSSRLSQSRRLSITIVPTTHVGGLHTLQ